MGAFYFLASLQIGDSPRYLQHPFIGPGGKSKFLKGPLEKLSCRLCQQTGFLEQGGRYIGITGDVCS